MRDKTRPQDAYCSDCLFYQEAGCNVILRDDEDECLDKVIQTPDCPKCGQWFAVHNSDGSCVTD